MPQPRPTYERLSPLIYGFYVVGALLILFPPLEAIVRLGSPKFGEVQWRFTALGVLSAASLLPLLGSLVLLTAAAVLDHRVVRRTLCVILAAVGLASVAGLAVFLLDGLELRASVRPEFSRAYDATFLKAAIMQALTAVSAIGLAVMGWKVKAPSARRAETKPQTPPIVRSRAAPAGKP